MMRIAVFCLILLSIRSIVSGQQVFKGGKFCEEGATGYTSRSVFDSIGNCFFIGKQGYKWMSDTFELSDRKFNFFYGKWVFNPKNRMVTTIAHDSFSLVTVKEISASNSSGIKSIRVKDFYGYPVKRFQVYGFISDTVVVKIKSDPITGVLTLNTFTTKKIYIPGIEDPLSTTSLAEETELNYIIPSSLIIVLPPFIRYDPEYRYKINEDNYTWIKPKLLPYGKYWMTLCDF